MGLLLLVLVLLGPATGSSTRGLSRVRKGGVPEEWGDVMIGGR